METKPEIPKFDQMFEGLSFVVALSKFPDGALVDVNKEWEKFFGFTRQEALGKTALELGINPDEDGRKRMIAELEKHGVVRDLQLTLRTKSGAQCKCLLNIDVLTTGDQKYYLNVLEDVTKRKK